MRNQLKTTLVLTFAVALALWWSTGQGQPLQAAFSGERHLLISDESLKAFPVIKARDLPGPHKELLYVGSTDTWHIFAEQLTSVAAGMPSDAVFGYKVPLENTSIANPLPLELPVTAFVQDCSPFSSTPEGKEITRIVITRQNDCVTKAE